jgi:hypothetical protein
MIPFIHPFINNRCIDSGHAAEPVTEGEALDKPLVMIARSFFSELVKVLSDSAVDTVTNLPPFVSIAPFGPIKTEYLLFLMGVGMVGCLYYLMWHYRIKHPGTSMKTKTSSRHESIELCGSHTHTSKFERVGTGFKEEVYEFMDTCVAVKGQLRHVEDPDRARTAKLQHLVKDAATLNGCTQMSSDALDCEDTSHSSTSNHNELVELCLGIRKGLNKVQDPDEARKQKLRRLRQIEMSRNAAEVSKQHQQAGFSTLWKPSVTSRTG